VSVTNVSEAIAAEEAALAARIAAGDVGAPVAELYRRYGRRLYRFGIKHLGNEGLAEEMVPETFVRLWPDRRGRAYLEAGRRNTSSIHDTFPRITGQPVTAHPRHMGESAVVASRT
jgi:hypothetical protein